MKKKYELIPSDIEGLYRIKALRNFADVKKGDIGGYIESENNLSHTGNAWVYGDARVCDNAEVSDNAWACGGARVSDNARVSGNAQVYDNARVSGNAQVYGDAWVSGNAEVSGNAQVYGNTGVYDNARVSGNARVYGNAGVYKDAEIKATKDYIVFKNWWSSGRYFTWTRSNNKWRVGCFYGTGEELVKKAYQDSEVSGREYERVVRYVDSILKDEEVI